MEAEPSTVYPLRYALETGTKGIRNVRCTKSLINSHTLVECEFKYPCPKSTDCEPYILEFLPNTYTIELYGPGGTDSDVRIASPPRDPITNKCTNLQLVQKTRGNVKCNEATLGRSLPGAGGYARGTINITQSLKAFLHIGGTGRVATSNEIPVCKLPPACHIDEKRIHGGYNGGGRGVSGAGSRSGSGATDLRFNENTLFHRVLVAGGGGSPDDPYTITPFGTEDGSAGAGGGVEGQGFWKDGIYSSENIATQNSGYSFGYGQASPGIHDSPGAPAGWFGAFAPGFLQGGTGGGSGFVLTDKSRLKIPQDEITVINDTGFPIDHGTYAFLGPNDYTFHDDLMVSGMWSGNGMARISFFQSESHQFSGKRVHCGVFHVIGILFYSFFYLSS